MASALIVIKFLIVFLANAAKHKDVRNARQDILFQTGIANFVVRCLMAAHNALIQQYAQAVAQTS